MRTEIFRRAARGGMIFAAAGLLNQAVTALGGLLLARALPPAVFGLYGVLSYSVSLWAFFGDIGFGPFLVQRKEDPPPALLRVAFTAWAGALALILLGIVLSAPLIGRWYGLDPAARWTLVGLAGALVLSLLRSIPTILLHRRMEFPVIARVELLEAAVFQAAAVPLAWAGAGVWSFVGAVWMSRLAGLGYVWRRASWPIGFGWDRRMVRDAMAMAGPLRLRDALALARLSLSPVIVGGLCGVPAVGFVTWAEGLTGLARFAGGIINQVALPTLSRLQADPSAVRAVVREAARFGCAWYLPFAAVLAALAGPLVHWVYTDRWVPAVPVLRLLLLSGVFSAPILLYDHLFVALGKPAWVLNFEWAFLAMNLALGVPLIAGTGAAGYGWTKLTIGVLTAAPYLWMGRRLVGVAPLAAVVRPAAVACVAGALAWGAGETMVKGIVGLAGVGMGILGASYAVLYLWERERWHAALAYLRAGSRA